MAYSPFCQGYVLDGRLDATYSVRSYEDTEIKNVIQRRKSVSDEMLYEMGYRYNNRWGSSEEVIIKRTGLNVTSAKLLQEGLKFGLPIAKLDYIKGVRLRSRAVSRSSLKDKQTQGFSPKRMI